MRDLEPALCYLAEYKLDWGYYRPYFEQTSNLLMERLQKEDLATHTFFGEDYAYMRDLCHQTDLKLVKLRQEPYPNNRSSLSNMFGLLGPSNEDLNLGVEEKLRVHFTTVNSIQRNKATIV